MTSRLALLLLLLLSTPALAEDSASVSVDELVSQLGDLVDVVGASEATVTDYDSFVARHQLAPTDALFSDFVRVKIAFEATRAGGLWGLQWTVTNQEPRSDAIWERWSALRSLPASTPSARAECDELSALFAFVVREMGVDDIGLFWPTWNHTVAVWKLKAADGTDVRVILPTSQVFLGPEETFDTEGFDPWTQKTIYTYTRADSAGDRPLDAALAASFVQRVREMAPASFETLQLIRNLRELHRAGLVRVPSIEERAERAIVQTLPKEDRAALRAFLAELSS